MKTVQRTERHIISKSHSLYNFCDTQCFLSKNLYNYAMYLVRQEYLVNKKWKRYFELCKELRHHESFKQLSAQTSQQTLKTVELAWKSFFQAKKIIPTNSKIHKIPQYKHKMRGRHVVTYTNQDCTVNKQNIITLLSLKIGNWVSQHKSRVNYNK